MEIKSYKVTAVIPTMQYGNIQPSIEIEGDDISEMKNTAMGHIKEMFAQYSEKPLTEADIVERISMSSFNEKDIVVEFDPIGHSYLYNGEILESASKFVSKHSKPFNAPVIAKNCEKPWGVPASEIEGMWGSNAVLATDFGNVVHKALEHWLKFRDNGGVILKNTDKEVNPALPKHPYLKSIIEDFDKICGEGKYLAEVFVTDIKGGKCGQIDRLKIVDEKKKICRVIDYKVNVGAEEISSNSKLSAPFKELPANKLSKYQVQLNYYREILENSGWTVEGMDVYVLEDVWKLYQLDILEI